VVPTPDGIRDIRKWRIPVKSRRFIKGPIEDALVSAFAGKNPESVVRGFALHLHTSATVGTSGPPYDPAAYAAWLGLPIEWREMAADGMLADWPGRSCRIVLRERQRDGDWAQRQRENFTIAHEIGHFMIREELQWFVPRALFERTNVDEERLCNRFAEELLMPSYRVVDDLSRCEGRPAALMALAATYNVSLKVMLCRMSRALREEIFAAIWRKTGSRYQLSWATPHRFGQLVLCDTGRTTVERAFTSDGEVEGRDNVILNGTRMRWPCMSVRLSGRQVLTIGTRSRQASPWRQSIQQDYAKPQPEGPVQLSLPLCA
jgi:hypothetical protein